MVNPELFRWWWDVFHSDDEIVEIRTIEKVNGRKKILSAYFNDCEHALATLQPISTVGVNIFSPINRIMESCKGRNQWGQFMQAAEESTSDKDIEKRKWLLIDFDPTRPTGINSSESEKEAARQLMLRVGTYLRDQGFRSPVVVMSGNGYHLYYRVDAPNTTESRQVCQDFLTVLDMMFSTDACEIDTSTFNAGRISKVVGSTAYKGRDTEDRPCRMAEFIRVPDFVETTPWVFVEKVASELPKKETPSRFNGYRTDFNIDTFIQEHGIEIANERQYKGGRKLVLKNCPFDPSHTAPDSALFVASSGAIGFKCLHNSCSHYTWKDFRLHFDPTAYSQRDQAEYQSRRDYYSTAPRPAPVIIEESDERGRKWLSMRSIEWQDPSKLTYIPTGWNGIDKQIGGLCLGDVTVMSGIAGSGKTSLINNLTLSAIQHGYKVALWSGELAPARFKSWINQAAAGRGFVKKAVGDSEYYYCPKDIADKIDLWTEDKLFLYNNNYGNKVSQILEDIKACIRDNGTQLIILDNLMALSLDASDGDKNERQAWLINALKDLAILSQIHILLVAHPRKEQMNSLLRMESISGSSDLYNAAANVFLCHRVGKDFEKRAKEFFGGDYVKEVQDEGYNEVIEVAKNRTHGTKDFIAGLFYEYETRRFLNEPGEHTVYAWQDPSDLPTEPVHTEWTHEELLAWAKQNSNEEDMPDDIF